MNSVCNSIIDSYKYWEKAIKEADINEDFIVDKQSAVKGSLYLGADVADLIFNEPDVWVKKHSIIIEGFAHSEKMPQDEARRNIGMSTLIAGISYIAISSSFSGLAGKYIDFAKLRSAIINTDKEKKGKIIDDVTSCELLFISEMKSKWSLSSKAMEYCASIVDEIMRSRIDAGKTTIISFSDGTESTLNSQGVICGGVPQCGLEIGKILESCAMAGCIYDKNRRIIKMTTSSRGLKDNHLNFSSAKEGVC